MRCVDGPMRAAFPKSRFRGIYDARFPARPACPSRTSRASSGRRNGASGAGEASGTRLSNQVSSGTLLTRTSVVALSTSGDTKLCDHDERARPLRMNCKDRSKSSH